MRKWIVHLTGLLVCIPLIEIPSLSAQARPDAPSEQTLSKIYDEAKNEFFATVNKLIAVHPRTPELAGDDVQKILDARNRIPNLFERVMIVAYQKNEPTYSQWIEKGDEESLAKFRKKFVELATDYAGRFVGSLFRQAPAGSFEFERALPHNRGKGRLDLVLQTLGYNAKNDPAPVPEEQRFTNKIEPDFQTQWALDAVNARKAQQISKGAGVIVAVLDSGLDPYNSLFKDRAVPGFGFLQRTKPPWEQEETSTVDWGMHGTATASTVLMIAPECRIMPVRVLDAETMNDPPYDYWVYEFMAAGIYYAVNHGAHIIQIGAALKSSEPVIAEAVRYAYRKNVVISTSAGNIPRYQWGLRPDDMLYRSFEEEVLLVGGVEKEEGTIRPWIHSVPGPAVDVATPSKDVFVIMPTYMKELKNDYVAGTSLASPIASGVVALMRSAAPPPAKLLNRPGAYSRLVSQCIRDTARLDILDLPEPNDIVGRGVMDAYAAIQKMQRAIALEK